MNDRNVNVVEEEGLCAQRELRAGVNALRRLLLQKRNAKFYPYTTSKKFSSGPEGGLTEITVGALGRKPLVGENGFDIKQGKAGSFDGVEYLALGEYGTLAKAEALLRKMGYSHLNSATGEYSRHRPLAISSERNWYRLEPSGRVRRLQVTKKSK